MKRSIVVSVAIDSYVYSWDSKEVMLKDKKKRVEAFGTQRDANAQCLPAV